VRRIAGQRRHRNRFGGSDGHSSHFRPYREIVIILAAGHEPDPRAIRTQEWVRKPDGRLASAELPHPAGMNPEACGGRRNTVLASRSWVRDRLRDRFDQV
jgi:hypothetical protein